MGEYNVVLTLVWWVTEMQEFTSLISAVTPIPLGEERVHSLFEEALQLDEDDENQGTVRDKFSPEAFSILCSKHGITPTTGEAGLSIPG